MAIVIKEIHVCTTIEKDRPQQQEIGPELVERLRQMIQDEIERCRLDEIRKRER